MAATAKQYPNFPDFGLVRLPQVLSVIPISPAGFWLGVKEGKFPQPRKLSKNVTVWRAEQIRELIDKVSAGEQPL